MSENAKNRLAEGLQRLRDRRTFEYSQRDPERRNKSKPEKDIGNGQFSSGLQAGSGSSGSLKIQQNGSMNIRLPWKNFPSAIANNKMGSLRFDAKDVEAPEYDGAKRKG